MNDDKTDNRTPHGVEEFDDDEEEISDTFTCCVCLDLLYKPIVLPCGHVSCFWCVHYSMNNLGESHCPTCRQPYYHFPTICQLFHFLIMKIYPDVYKRREAQVLEQERTNEVFSPQFDTCTELSQRNKELVQLSSPEISNLEQAYSGFQNYSSAMARTTAETCSESTSTEVEVILPPEKKVSISDVLCATCNQMLFHPVVLNCGHVYCETCIMKPTNDVIRCQICQCPHPNGLPKDFLVLDHFLEEQFPMEYNLRKRAVQQKQVNIKKKNPKTCSAKASEQGSSWWSDHRSQIHFNVGCDHCGMYPIVGDRYRCKDCTEKIGFDLCADCYISRSNLPGRFNQQHKPEHRFELLHSNITANIMLRMVTERFEASPEVLVSNDTAEDSENGLSVASVEFAENSENSLATNVTANDSSEDRDDHSE